MRNFTKLLLLFALLAVAQSSSANAPFVEKSWHISFSSTTASDLYNFSTTPFIDYNVVKTGLDVEKVWNAKKGGQYERKFTRYKKKFKRVATVFTGLKPPFRVEDPVPVPVYANESYSKPHFLSHLHHFLFRLTPF